MARPLFLRRLRKYVAALPALAFGFMASPAFSTVVTLNTSGVSEGTSTASFVGATLTSAGGSVCASGMAFCILSASGVWRGSALPKSAILSPATERNGGIFKIVNPFGPQPLTSIQFLSWPIRDIGDANSDYGLVSVGPLGLAVAGRGRARG